MKTMNQSRLTLITLASTFFLILGALAPAAAQPAGYTKLNIKGRVQIEIPADWSIGDAEHRKRVKDTAEKLTGVEIGHTASLSAQSFPVPSTMFVRVSFMKLEPAFTQAEVKTDGQQVVRDMAGMWKEESAVMWAALAKKGVKEVGRPSFAVEPIGGQTAIVIRYGRTLGANSTETMKVAQYHVPLGAEKALITLSYVDGNKRAMAAHDRLKSSIVIR